MLRGASPIKAALFGAAFFIVAATGCSTPGNFRDGRQIAAWAGERGFAQTVVPAGAFQLAAFVRRSPSRGAVLAVYIEGDGAAWPTAYRPPQDPTPVRPVALTLAAEDPAGVVTYLARPCQYLDAAALRTCDVAYWTERRFAPEVIAAYDVAIDRLKIVSGASRVRLHGYSGGGVVATLVAARREDVDALVTVAAPLALADWVSWHGATVLSGSIDPSGLEDNDVLARAVHFVGSNDRIVPPGIVERFVRRKGGRMEQVAGVDHDCCWATNWATLLARTMKQEGSR